MKIKFRKNQGRVRESSSKEQNQAIDEDILACIRRYKNSSEYEIQNRLKDLQDEWDIERVLQVNASAIILSGLTLGALVSKKWYILPGVVAGFLLQHGLQGWCPPLPIFRELGVRTKREIEEERYALKLLRGDFGENKLSNPIEILNAIRKS
jgi:hypothetical protein